MKTVTKVHQLLRNVFNVTTMPRQPQRTRHQPTTPISLSKTSSLPTGPLEQDIPSTRGDKPWQHRQHTMDNAVVEHYWDDDKSKSCAGMVHGGTAGTPCWRWYSGHVVLEVVQRVLRVASSDKFGGMTNQAWYFCLISLIVYHKTLKLLSQS